MQIALDTETSGLDIRHGCRPFFVSTCNSDDKTVYWQWDVDPHTRQPIIPPGEIDEIQEYLDSCERLVLFNAPFDMLALLSVGVKIDHLWKKTDDVLIKSHIYNSLESHKLKHLCIKYLDILDDDQEALGMAVKKARRIGRRLKWDIARKDHPHFPGIKKGDNDIDSLWPADMWLPRALWLAGEAPDDSWESVCRVYGLRDAERTLILNEFYDTQLNAQSLTDVYEEHRQLLHPLFRMSQNGVTVKRSVLMKQFAHHTNLVKSYSDRCITLSGEPKLNLNSNNQLQKVLFQGFNIPVTEVTDKGNPSTNTLAILKMMDVSQGKPLEFLQNYKARGEHNGILRYVKNYNLKKFTRVDKIEGRYHRYNKMHFSFNQTGTATTRFTSDGAQTISKKVKKCFWCAGAGGDCKKCEGTGWSNLSLRNMFGPRPGRCWVSADYSNIEMRILARKANVESFLDIFREGKTTVHLAVAKLMFPDLYQRPDFKKLEEYGKTKNGNFAISYGAGQEKADLTYEVPGGYEILLENYPDVKNFKHLLAELKNKARKQGGIFTLGGYPLVIPSHKPYAVLNYFVQGSAGIVMKRAIVRCDRWITQNPERDVQMIMTIHDELVFDMPAPTTLIPEKDEIFLDNVKQLSYNMESPGDDDDFGIPLPVEPMYHPVSWADGIDFTNIIHS